MSAHVDLSTYEDARLVTVRRSERPIAALVLARPRGALEVVRAADASEAAVSSWARSAGKRGFDLVFGAILFVLSLPVLLFVAVAILIEDGRPVFFRQRRAGTHGRPFGFLKFRSMVKDAEARKRELTALNESADGVIFKMRRDPRVTRVGRFIRKTSLDELPQIVHVLSGRMSLVGPRPHPVAEAAEYSERARLRLSVKPGITCLWQIMGRSELPFGEQIVLDELYMKHAGFWMDLKILLKTVPAVVLGRGAY